MDGVVRFYETQVLVHLLDAKHLLVMAKKGRGNLGGRTVVVGDFLPVNTSGRPTLVVPADGPLVVIGCVEGISRRLALLLRGISLRMGLLGR